jgi:hypothetical protein
MWAQRRVLRLTHERCPCSNQNPRREDSPAGGRLVLCEVAVIRRGMAMPRHQAYPHRPSVVHARPAQSADPEPERRGHATLTTSTYLRPLRSTRREVRRCRRPTPLLPTLAIARHAGPAQVFRRTIMNSYWLVTSVSISKGICSASRACSSSSRNSVGVQT